ncbi:MAG: hypothetical protein ACFE0S_00370 [Rhodospirillales bacterium]
MPLTEGEKAERKEAQDRILSEHESLFHDQVLRGDAKGYGKGLACGPGWYHLIQVICEVLSGLRADGRPDLQITQVKEKFGGLTIYTSMPRDKKVWGATQTIKAISHQVCDVCGQPGRARLWPGLIATLCAEHAELEKIDEAEPVSKWDHYFSPIGVWDPDFVRTQKSDISGALQPERADEVVERIRHFEESPFRRCVIAMLSVVAQENYLYPRGKPSRELLFVDDFQHWRKPEFAWLGDLDDESAEEGALWLIEDYYKTASWPLFDPLKIDKIKTESL